MVYVSQILWIFLIDLDESIESMLDLGGISHKVRDVDLGLRVECGNGHLAQPVKRCLGNSHLLICNRCVECTSLPTEPNRLRVWVLSPIFEPLKLDGLLLPNQALESSDLL